MPQLDLALLSILRALVEIAGFALLGQAVLALLAGASRQQNPFYKILRTVAQPAVRTTRFLAPRRIVDAHIPPLTFILLFSLWLALAYAKRLLCGLHGLPC
jgi:hypothetical protein